MKPRPLHITLAQHNVSRARHVTDEIRFKLTTQKAEILLLQEPYAINNKPQTLGSQVKILTSKKKDEYPWAAIAVTNPTITVTNLKHHGNCNTVVAEIIKEQYKLYAISGYLSPHQDVTFTLNHLGGILHTLRGSNIILGIDSNAHSTSWGSATTDAAGEAIEMFIAQHDLTIINEPSNITIFCSNWGSSNIDLTLARGSIKRRISDWRVEDNWTTSDHRELSLNITTTRVSPLLQTQVQARYKTKLRSYISFNVKLKHNLNDIEAVELNARNIDNYTVLLENCFIKTAETTLKKPNNRRTTVPWWTASLTKLRKETHTDRKLFQNARNEHREQKRLKYIATKKRYVLALRRAKRDSWRSYVAKESQRNP